MWRHVTFSRTQKESIVEFIGKTLQTIKSREFFSQIKVKGELFSVGDFIAVADEEKPETDDIGRIEYMWRDGKGQGHLHVHWFT